MYYTIAEQVVHVQTSPTVLDGILIMLIHGVLLMEETRLPEAVVTLNQLIQQQDSVGIRVAVTVVIDVVQRWALIQTHHGNEQYGTQIVRKKHLINDGLFLSVFLLLLCIGKECRR